MDIRSFILGFKKGKASGGGSSFPMKEFFEGTCKELTLTGVITLKTYALYNNSAVERIFLPNTETIGAYGISQNASLAEIILYEGLKTVDIYGISYCAKLPSIVFPRSLVSMGWNAMYGCSGLKTVTFLGTPASIGTQFSSTVFPSTVETINVPWSEGEVAGAPWGAASAQINYNYTGG